MVKSDDIEKLPLPKSWPELAKRALVLVNSMLKVSFDIEVGRRLDSAPRHCSGSAIRGGLSPAQSTPSCTSNQGWNL
ncbi:MAG: hypothetical protein ACYS5V_15325 [Planctomycetota bacterium]